jgi:hypothetical protein
MIAGANDPRRPCPRRPVVDEYSAAVLDEAVHSLTMLRAPLCEGDAITALHALCSLVAQAQSWLGDLVTDAREQGHSWREIADQLDMSRPRALIRFAGHAHTRRTMPIDLD